VRSFSTNSRPALRAACGRPPARQRHGGHRGASLTFMPGDPTSASIRARPPPYRSATRVGQQTHVELPSATRRTSRSHSGDLSGCCSSAILCCIRPRTRPTFARPRSSSVCTSSNALRRFREALVRSRLKGGSPTTESRNSLRPSIAPDIFDSSSAKDSSFSCKLLNVLSFRIVRGCEQAGCSFHRSRPYVFEAWHLIP
jgi:hypothetical protein